MRALKSLVLCRRALVMTPSPALAQRLDLSLSPAVITFPSSDPGYGPARRRRRRCRSPIASAHNGNSPWSLTVLAAGDLISGASRVDISNVTWVATPGASFPERHAQQDRRAARGLGQPATSIQTAIGSITFRLANSWTYSTGIYTQTVLFTLSAP